MFFLCFRSAWQSYCQWRRSKQHEKRNPFYITNEELQQIALSDTAIAVSELCRLITVAVGDESRGKLSAAKVAAWLVNKEFLKVITSADGKNKKMPTDAGRELGITVDHRTSVHGDYDVNLYDRQAQQFIVDNLTGILQEDFA